MKSKRKVKQQLILFFIVLIVVVFWVRSGGKRKDQSASLNPNAPEFSTANTEKQEALQKAVQALLGRESVERLDPEAVKELAKMVAPFMPPVPSPENIKAMVMDPRIKEITTAWVASKLSKDYLQAIERTQTVIRDGVKSCEGQAACVCGRRSQFDKVIEDAQKMMETQAAPLLEVAYKKNFPNETDMNVKKQKHRQLMYQAYTGVVCP